MKEAMNFSGSDDLTVIESGRKLNLSKTFDQQDVFDGATLSVFKASASHSQLEDDLLKLFGDEKNDSIIEETHSSLPKKTAKKPYIRVFTEIYKTKP